MVFVMIRTETISNIIKLLIILEFYYCEFLSYARIIFLD